MKKRRIVTRVGIVVGLLAVLGLLAGASTVATGVQRALPDLDGSVQIDGVSGPVTVYRDDQGVPQVYAETSEDLFLAQGYVQAQDRFWQMDYRRHVTSGRLAELVGDVDGAVASDTVVRTLGWRDVAEEEAEQLDATTLGYLEAYAKGVNAYLAGRTAGELDLNYTVLGVTVTDQTVEPWTVVDSLAWFKAMAWDLSGNTADELGRSLVYGQVDDVSRVEQLWPDYPYARNGTVVDAASDTAGADADAATGTLGSTSVQDALTAVQDALEAVPVTMGRDGSVGSNAWVVSGEYTSSGQPLLANDTHLGTSLPGVWYQMGLHCTTVGDACPFDVSGYTFAGVPGVVIGHNQTVTWGLANLDPDVSDFYVEQVEGDTYLRDGDYVDMQTHDEVIEVAGGDPVTITVRSTVHGPVLSDVLSDVADLTSALEGTDDEPTAEDPADEEPAAEGTAADATGDGSGDAAGASDGAATGDDTEYAVSLAWTGLRPSTDIEAVFALDQATDFASFRAAAKLLTSPAQNVVYADTDGHIGYQATGLVPVRGGGTGAKKTQATKDTWPVTADGTWPMPGWDSSYDWKGFVDVDDLPYAKDPESGYVVAANQAVTPKKDTTVYLTSDWDYGYRAARISAQLDTLVQQAQAGDKITVDDMTALQNDSYDTLAADLVPLLLQTDVDSFTAEGRALLEGWDYQETADSSAAAYYNAVWSELLRLTFEDEVPEAAEPTADSRWAEVVRRLLERPEDEWWDNSTTTGVVETRDEILREAMVAARLDLTSDLGKDTADWSWGALHTLELKSALGGSSSTVLLHWLLNISVDDVPGSGLDVNAMVYDPLSGSFEVTTAPSMRMVVDLGDLDASRWVNQVGASGHVFSENYSDQLDTWLEGGTYPWYSSAEAVQGAAAHTLTLTPAA